MKADQVRSAFVDFFVEKQHEHVRSASLVPANDKTLLFTNAGMVQFKDLFTGSEKRSYTRATTSQKCVRAGGKHNDLDSVGETPRHQTFFEMLGNFSFGDYFKEDAIAWAWELLTSVYGIDKDRLIVTVFSGDRDLGVGGDDDARAIWKRVTGFSNEKIIGLGKAENFWMMGDTGPMGPCSEIHYCMSKDLAALPTSDSPEAAWESWLEIWNLVFMQYERKVKNGVLDKLPAPSIDTGAGLERVTSVLQGVSSNYETDLFTPLLTIASELCGKKYGDNDSDDTSMRVIADHARATAFLVADGVFPDKKDREYVLRRIFRRAVRHGKLLNIEEPFMHRVCEVVVDRMGDAFPELRQRASIIGEVAIEEEKRFRSTLDRGLHLLEEEFVSMRKGGKKQVAGAKVFQLYDTFGFPSDLTQIIATENGFSIDTTGFEEELETARDRSKFAGAASGTIGEIFKQVAGDVGPTDFVGYQTTSAHGTVAAIIVDGETREIAGPGTKVAFLCDTTPFYAESGGQIGDAGTAVAGGLCVRIHDTKKPAGDAYVHFGVVEEGELRCGQEIELAVDNARRSQIRANHSATHLLHSALKEILGDHVAQKGSLVTPDRLRFDFAHFNPMTAEERVRVENMVNSEILRNLAATTDVLAVDEARERGAVAMFGEKYGEKVRVVQIGNDSLEFCGGTHVTRTGDIGLFKLIAESGIAQGVRRVEAVSGIGALQYVRKIEGDLASTGMRLKVGPAEVPARVAKLHGDFKALEKEVASLKSKLAAGGSRDLMAEVREIGGIKVLATSTEVTDAKALRQTGDTLRDRIGSGVVVLAGISGDKVALLAMVTKDLTDKFHAGKLLKLAAEILGGRGGGRPDMAQGGGNDASKVPEALAKVIEVVESTR